jgi:tetratricopeptide (TPR) repeat protein
MKKGRRQQKREETGSQRGCGAWLWAAIGALAAAGVMIWKWPAGRTQMGPGEAPSDKPAPVVEREAEAFAAYAGSASCRECHREAYALWAKSNHGLAERHLRPEMDRAAFEPARSFPHGTQSSDVRLREGHYQVVTLGFGSNRAPYRPERVIGHDPLRQFLVAAPGSRLQTLEVAYDPRRNEWFNVYGEEDRQPGEWGHWTGRGMNWNSMCASCHNTRLRKNYDAASDSYHTAMAEMSVGCEACHGPMKAHVTWRRSYPDSRAPDPSLRKLSADQVLDTCGTCHSRRREMTGDFRPGDPYSDHFALVTVDETDLYYPDGQVREEDYEFAAFLGSRMHAAGVRCLDCHQPHSAKTLLPDNQLCLRCHNGSYTNSPVIDPAAHSFHKVDGPGSQCVGCHMPLTTYMQRHPRHDHGFTIPDPLLTQQLGVPNACNRCHTDKDTDWTLAAVEKWYGKKMDRYSRRRTQWIAAARKGEESARDPLLSLLHDNETPYWKAVAARLLGQWIDQPEVARAVRQQLRHSNAMVRAASIQGLEPLAGTERSEVLRELKRLLSDPSREVRLAAAWALRATLDPQSIAGRELQHTLDTNADQPGGRMQMGAFAASRQDWPGAMLHFQKAVEWDPNSAPCRHELAVALSTLGRSQEALAQMKEAARLEPKQPEYVYKLALAWNEVGELDQAIHGLEATVRLEPRHSRAWYNLGLARSAKGDVPGALEALQRAQSVAPRDPRIPYARATIYAREGRAEEARAEARRALELQPDSAEALALLKTLGR